MNAICNIPNCGRSCPADEAFCSVHRDTDWKSRALTAEKERDEALARVREVEGETPGPLDRGSFEGDIFFGDPRNSTRGTHRWEAGKWVELPSETVTLMELLSVSRSRASAAEARAEALQAQVEGIAQTLIDAESHIVALAFEIPAPNKVTPRLVTGAQALARTARQALSTLTGGRE